MSLAVGIDLGRHYVRAVVLEQRGSSTTVLQLLEEKIIGDNHVSALQQLLKTIPKEVPTSVCLPLDQAVMRPVEFPFNDKLKIRETIGFKMESLLQGGIDEYIVDYYSRDSETVPATVLGFAMPKEQLATRLKVLSEADCDPQQINLDIFSLATLFSAHYIEEDALSVLVDISREGTRISIVKNAKVYFVRSLRQGCHWLASFIAQHASLSIDEARSLCF